MKLRRKVAAIVLIGAMVVGGETGRVSAQDAPPDLRMLMNLDLFESRHNSAQGAPAPAAAPTDDSMLDQIRTLDAMGYLGNHGDANGGAQPASRAAVGVVPGAEDVAPAKLPAPQTPSSQPSYDVEGPQQ
jgi:hypothetical protein